MAIGARKQPLYDQLVDILTEKIDHEYRAGDMILPSANFRSAMVSRELRYVWLCRNWSV